MSVLTHAKSSLGCVFFPSSRALLLRATLAAALGVSVAACSDATREETPAADSVAVLDTAMDSVELTTLESTYDPALGDILLLPVVGEASDRELATLLSPLIAPDAIPSDTTGLRERVGPGAVQLFSRAGLLGDGIVRVDAALATASTANGCATWPMARVALAPGVPIGARWLVALPAGRVSAIPLDSIEALPSRDSSVLAAALTRAASALEEDSGSAFRGLPFTVLRAYRSASASDSAAANDGFAVGVLVRRIPQEDRPLEERVLILVSTVNPNPKSWTAVWFERASGREEEVIASEPLAAFRLVGGSRRITLVVGRDDGSGTSLALLERVGASWRVRWESALTGC